jgi:hypothetical protein
MHCGTFHRKGRKGKKDKGNLAQQKIKKLCVLGGLCG